MGLRLRERMDQMEVTIIGVRALLKTEDIPLPRSPPDLAWLAPLSTGLLNLPPDPPATGVVPYIAAIRPQPGTQRLSYRSAPRALMAI
jgi:hypothetical protein